MIIGCRLILFAFVTSLAGGLVWSANHYHHQYLKEQKRADDAETLAEQRQATIHDMQKRQRDIAAIDAKYTEELANAKATIEQLQRDVAGGSKRLQVSSTCKPVPRTTSTTSVDDAARARLTDTAERDYFTLRERIETTEKLISGMQDFIRHQYMR